MYTLKTYGYVVGRGRPERANDPETNMNREIIGSIIEFCNRLEQVPRELLRLVFDVSRVPEGAPVRLLRGIWFETDLYNRPEFARMLEVMRSEGGLLQGNLVIKHRTDLASKVEDQSAVERQNLKLLDQNPIAIWHLDAPSIRAILTKSVESLTSQDFKNLLMKGVDDRFPITQWVRALKTIPFPSDPDDSDEDTKRRVITYDFNSDMRYIGNRERAEKENLLLIEMLTKKTQLELDL